MSGYPIGSSDFIAYWSAFQVFISGQNPYDEATLRIVQQNIFPHIKETQMFINPPWGMWMLFAIYAPLFYLPFDIARLLWLTINLDLLILCAWLLSRLYQPHRAPWRYIFLTTFCFIPALACINSGQLSLVVCSSLFGAFWMLKNNKDYAAGALLVPVMIKPQIAHIILSVLLVYLIKNKRWKVILTAAAVFSLFALPFTQSAVTTYSQWFHQSFDPNLWRTSALSTPIRVQAIDRLNYDPWWVGFAIAGVANLIAIVWASRNDINWEIHLPLLACVSLIFTPYAWVFDYSLLLVVALWALTLSYKQARQKQTVIWLILTQASLLLVSSFVESLEYFVFFPLLMLLFYFQTKRAQIINPGRITPTP